MSTSFALKLAPSLPEGRYVSTIVQNTQNVHLNEKYTRSTGIKSFFSSARKTGTTLLMGMLIVIMGFLGLVQSAAPAQAFDPLGVGEWLDNNFCAPESRFRVAGPEVYGSGTLLLTGPSGANLTTAGDPGFLSQRRTAYEKYGITGARWQNYRPAEAAVKRTNEILGISDRDAGDRRKEANCFDPVSEVGTYFANFVFDGTKLVVLFTTWFYGAVYQPDFMDSINNAVGTIITGEGNSPGLKDILYFEFLNLVLLFSALYLGWTGLVKKQSTQAMSSGLWMFGAVMVGSLLVYNPTFLPNATNSMISQVEMALMRGTTGVALGISDTQPDKNICYAPNRQQVDDALPSNNTAAAIERQKRQAIEGQKDQVIRSMECVIWATFIYTPWVSGQFGMSPTQANDTLKFVGEETGAVNLGGGTTITGNVALYQLDQQTIDRAEVADPDARLNNVKNWFTVVAESFWAEDAPNAVYADSWSGTADPGSRIGVAFLSLISASVGLASIVVISLSILMYSVAMALLMFVSVLFLLMGAHPGMGRGIALRWAEMYVGTIFKRVIAAALLGMIMAFYAVILSSNIGFGTSLIAIVALSIAALSYRKTIMDAFTSFSFGGTNAGIENSQAFKRAGGGIAGAALGAAAVIGGGSALGAASSAKGAALASGASKGAAARAGMGGAFKAIGAGSFRAAKTGAVSGRFDGMSASFAAQQADAVGQRVAGKYKTKEDKQTAKNARNIRDTDAQNRRENPAEKVRRSRQAEARKKHYAKDYSEHGGSQEWRDAFEKTYGFEAYDPTTDTSNSGFGGYGLDVESQDYQEAEAWRQAEIKADQERIAAERKAEHDRLQAERAEKARAEALAKARASQDAVDENFRTNNASGAPSSKSGSGIPQTNGNSTATPVPQPAPEPRRRGRRPLPSSRPDGTTDGAGTPQPKTPTPQGNTSKNYGTPPASTGSNQRRPVVVDDGWDDAPAKPATPPRPAPTSTGTPDARPAPTATGTPQPRPTTDDFTRQEEAELAKRKAASQKRTQEVEAESKAAAGQIRNEIQESIMEARKEYQTLQDHRKEALRRKAQATSPAARQQSAKDIMLLDKAIQDNKDLSRTLQQQYNTEG